MRSGANGDLFASTVFPTRPSGEPATPCGMQPNPCPALVMHRPGTGIDGVLVSMPGGVADDR